MGLVYDKLTRVCSSVSKGAVMTLVGTDVNRITDLAECFHDLWAAPAIVLVVIGLSWRLLGVAVLPGMAVIGLVVSLNIYSSQLFSTVQDGIMEHQQTRMQRLAEMLEVCVVSFPYYPSMIHGIVMLI